MKKIITLFIMLMFCNISFADNLVMNYFKKWVDETKVEKAIGKLLLDQFTSDLQVTYKISENQELTKSFISFLEKCGAKNNNGLEIKVMMIDSSTADEILLPGGTLILTKGFWDYAQTKEQQDFILARNAFLVFQKQPLFAIKHSGIYPRFLDYLKLKESKRSKEEMRELLRSYLMVLQKMNHKKADVQGALITYNPDKTRIEAINMLSKLAENISIWPPSPLDNRDLPSRIVDLKNLKLPEQKL